MKLPEREKLAHGKEVLRHKKASKINPWHCKADHVKSASQIKSSNEMSIFKNGASAELLAGALFLPG